MRQSSGLAILVWLAACRGAVDPWPTRTEDLAAVEAARGPVVPPVAAPIFLTFAKDLHPCWRIRENESASTVGTEIRVRRDVATILVVRAESPVRVEIPAMRFDKAVVPGRPSLSWFTATRTGTWPIVLTTPWGTTNGTVVVVD
ncbi:MAG: hypothetical protein IPK26_01620 [Planctomycetes bacterium]|nr:hypothetical protein [Planctomycetota bacterium]